MIKTPLFCILIALLQLNSVFAQEGTVTIHEDEKLTALLKLKNKLSKENKLTDGFTIQLFNGELKDANNAIRDYNRTLSTWSATIEYETPNYKVWVGNFLTRLEADRALLEIQKSFPNAFVLRPERKNP